MSKDKELSKFYAFLARPLFFRTRFLLALLVLPLAFSLTQPLWRIQVYAPQYPQGLTLDIYAHTIDGGRQGADVREINILNHYVGMRALDPHELTDLDWIPFALGLMSILALRCAAVGDVRSLVDVVVVTFYVAAFAMMRFAYRLHGYGHNLNPDAAVKLPPFTPPIFGSHQVGEFATRSGPQAGTYWIGAFALGAVGILFYHLLVGRRREVDAPSVAKPTPAEAASGDDETKGDSA